MCCNKKTLKDVETGGGEEEGRLFFTLNCVDNDN
jgi:hypothetical protein